MTLKWNEVAAVSLPTLGYVLEMLNDDDTWGVVSDERNNPNALQATVTGLISGRIYKFRVFALDFNGFSGPSEVIEVYACGLPRGLAVPTYVLSSRTSIKIEWQAP